MRSQQAGRKGASTPVALVAGMSLDTHSHLRPRAAQSPLSARRWALWGDSLNTCPSSLRRARGPPAHALPFSLFARRRRRGQHGGEDEAAGIRAQQEEGAGAAQPNPLHHQRPTLLVRVSARPTPLPPRGSAQPAHSQPPTPLQEDPAQLAGPELPASEWGVGLLPSPHPGHVRRQRRLSP